MRQDTKVWLIVELQISYSFIQSINWLVNMERNYIWGVVWLFGCTPWLVTDVTLAFEDAQVFPHFSRKETDDTDDTNGTADTDDTDDTDITDDTDNTDVTKNKESNESNENKES